MDCDVGHVPCADIATVGALARASLNAHRRGERLRVVNASPELEQLIELAGLDAVLLGRSRRQPEEREEAVGVEEGREPHDPSV
ncbi:MAG: STAS domain-containing protein [Gaiellaceae bacterium]